MIERWDLVRFMAERMANTVVLTLWRYYKKLLRKVYFSLERFQLINVYHKIDDIVKSIGRVEIETYESRQGNYWLIPICF